MRSPDFCVPIRPGIIQAAGYFAQAANEVRLEAIVNMSQISARRGARSHAARDHWIAERLLERSGIPVTHLRPTFFAEWLIYLAPRVAKDGYLALPFGTGRHAAIAAKDQARVISAILLNPAPHRRQIYPLYGAEELSYAEMADAMSEVLVRTIRYEQIDFEAFGKALLSSGKEVFLAQHLKEVAIDHTNGIFAGTNDLVEKLTGKKPQTVREFISKHKGMFALPSTQSTPS